MITIHNKFNLESFAYCLLRKHNKTIFYFQASSFTIYNAVDLYKFDLESFAYCRLPRYPMKKSFKDREDGALLHLVRECTNIHTLVYPYNF